MRVTEFIVCDDIRIEQLGKISVTGIYGESILLYLPPDVPWPIPFRMAVFIRLNADGQWQEECTFTLRIDLNGAELVRFDGKLDKRPPGDSLVLPLIAPFIQLPGPGAMSLKLEVRDKEGGLLCSSVYPFKLSLERGPIPNPNR